VGCLPRSAGLFGRVLLGCEACVCDLNDAFDLTQPTISHHLKVLHEAGLLDRDKRGVWVYYRARTEALASLAALIADPRP
jgi:ArsR family transcriptional regulator, arsenate/arsenite/antimonite-responsive transcriptional repressor